MTDMDFLTLRFDELSDWFRTIQRRSEESLHLYALVDGVGVVIEQPDVSAKDIADTNACELGMTWEKPISLPPLVTAFFDHIFHNTMTEPLNDAALNNVSYFMLRPIEDLPSPTAALPDPIPGAGVL